MRTRISLVFVLLLTGCISVSNNDIQPGDAEPAIARANDRFVSALRTGNVEQLVAAYSDSAVVLPPNAPAMIGRDSIRQFWTGFLGIGAIDGKLMTENVTQTCDMAAERGRYELTITPRQPGAAAIHDRGKYVVVWRKIGGEWKMWNDIFNSDLAR